MRQTFDDYNDTGELVDGSAAIHPRYLGMLMLRRISSNGPFAVMPSCESSTLLTETTSCLPTK
jgi:hypothetical protein